MTKSELIDAVKRWQVAEHVTLCENWQFDFKNGVFLVKRDFWSATRTFLALLEQLKNYDDLDFCDESFEYWREKSTGLTDCFVGDPEKKVLNATQNHILHQTGIPGVGFGG